MLLLWCTFISIFAEHRNPGNKKKYSGVGILASVSLYLYSWILFFSLFAKVSQKYPWSHKQIYFSICILGSEHMYFSICILECLCEYICPALLCPSKETWRLCIGSSYLLLICWVQKAKLVRVLKTMTSQAFTARKSWIARTNVTSGCCACTWLPALPLLRVLISGEKKKECFCGSQGFREWLFFFV